MPVTSLYVANVGPFDEIEFTFDHQVNVFTGPNNSGKSSALWVLGDITVYPFSSPEKLLRQGHNGVFKLRLSGPHNRKFSGRLPCHLTGPHDQGSENEYWNRERTKEYIVVLGEIGYSKFIPALRRSTDYRSPGPTANKEVAIDDEPTGRRKKYRLKQYAEAEEEPELKKRLALVSDDPTLVGDEAVIQKMIELDYRSYLRTQPSLGNIMEKIAELTSEITDGFPITFAGVDEDSGGFFPKFDTIDGPVALNTLSQGTQSIIQWLAHLLVGYSEYYDFPEDLEEKAGILIVDEIDAHLHPSWQRRVIPTLTRHFPNLQIFCSTHSPLMLAGLKEGQVQLLHRDENGKIGVTRNNVDIGGWTADEILRNFLGILDPTDLEASSRLEKLQYLRRRKDLSAEEMNELDNLRRTVCQDLVSGPVSADLEQLAGALTEAVSDSTRSSSASAGSRENRKAGE